MDLTNWLRNLKQNILGQRNRKLRRRQSAAFSTIAAVVETLESRQLLSVAGPAAVAQATHVAGTPVLHSQGPSAGGNATAAATTSTNWSGYVATNNTANSVTQVSGSWTVPTVARSAANSYSSVWVGIDGWLGNTVEQIGTEQDMVNDSPVDYAWYEMWSSGKQQPEQKFATVSPGDSVTANVQYMTTGAHAGQFQLSFADLSRPAGNFTTYQTSAATQAPVATRSQAEWIVEAPLENGSVASLANFGTVAFSKAAATINGISEPINGPYSISPPVNVYQVDMVQNGVAVDTTSSLTSGQTGSSFTVTFAPQTPALSAPQMSARLLSSSSVSLAWNAVSGAQGYRVYKWDGSQEVLVATFSSSTTGAQISGLSAGTSYSFLVEAFNGSQVADSAWISVATQRNLTAPQVSARVLSSSSVSLAWNAVSGAQGYRVYKWNGSQEVLAATVSSLTTSAQISSLSAGISYSFLVEAFYGSQVADSAWISVATQRK